jgi:hypothetical protein
MGNRGEFHADGAIPPLRALDSLTRRQCGFSGRVEMVGVAALQQRRELSDHHGGLIHLLLTRNQLSQCACLLQCLVHFVLCDVTRDRAPKRPMP